MSNITLDFQQAKVKHLQFKSNLRSILYGAADIDENPILSHFECTVGKWIYEYALGQYGYLPEMIALENVHAEIHKKADELVSLYKAGKELEARSGLNEMEIIAEKLVNLLALLENKLKTNSDNFKGSPDYQSPAKTIKELQKLTRTNEELDKIINRQSIELVHERKILRDLFMELPAMIAILKGKEHIIEMGNKPFLDFIGNEHVAGKPVKEVLPEMMGQGFLKILDKVYETGETFISKASLIAIDKPDGVRDEMYADLSFVPLKNIDGITDGIISFSYDVSQLVKSGKLLEESANHIKHAHEDLEVKVAFRNLQLEKEVAKLKKKLEKFEKSK